MVFFVCSACGTSLKKNQVEKHTYQCRSKSFSCIDCNKDFIGDEYKLHTKCMTEIERYSAKGWKPPANFNKGEKKQTEWLTIVQGALDKHANTLNPASRNLLHTIANHDNIPRKKPKFINFINNVCRRGFNESTINEVWDIIENEWKRTKEPPTPQVEPPQPEEEIKKKKKRKNKEVEEGSTNGVCDILESESKETEIQPLGEELQPEEEIKKKKKRKNKEVSEILESESKETESPPPVEEEQIKKKKKRKDKGIDVTNEVGDILEKLNEPSPVEELQPQEEIKKKKKRNHKEVEEKIIILTSSKKKKTE